MSTHDHTPLLGAHPGSDPVQPAPPQGLSLATLRSAVMYAHDRLEDDLRSFTVFDRVTGEEVFGSQVWPEGNRALFKVSDRVDQRLPVSDELGEVRDWWMLNLSADNLVVVFLQMGRRHRGILIVDNTYGRLGKVFGNVVPGVLMQCREER